MKTFRDCGHMTKSNTDISWSILNDEAKKSETVESEVICGQRVKYRTFHWPTRHILFNQTKNCATRTLRQYGFDFMMRLKMAFTCSKGIFAAYFWQHWEHGAEYTLKRGWEQANKFWGQGMFSSEFAQPKPQYRGDFEKRQQKDFFEQRKDHSEYRVHVEIWLGAPTATC